MGRSETLQLKTNPRSYVQARLTIAGARFDQVGVHLKGAVGSFQPLDEKPSLTLDLNRFTPGQSLAGLKKLHLNNSAEDPSYLCEWLGGILFREAGIPAPAVGLARVRLNGRNLGLYVAKEGFSRDFLKRSLGNSTGILLEPKPRQDVRGDFEVKVGDKGAAAATRLQDLATALDEPDLQRRRERLDHWIDRDLFARFIALEVLLGHRDGYALARNNYRVYLGTNQDSILWIPHGMDQLLQNPKAVPNPAMAGEVARSWMEIPENRTLFNQTLEDLNATVFQPPHVTQILEDIWQVIHSSLTISESRKLRNELERLRARAHERHAFLADHFAASRIPPLEFQGSSAVLSGWKPAETQTGTVTELTATATLPSRLQLSLNSPGLVSSQVNVTLSPGRYRFRSSIRVANFEKLPFGKHHGAFLRIAGTDARSKDSQRADTFESIELEFEVPGHVAQTRTLVCELRGKSGTAWFDIDSLKIDQIGPPPSSR